MTAHIHPCLAAFKDTDLDGTLVMATDERGNPCLIPRNKPHHAELVKRGLAGDPALAELASKFRPDAFRLEERQ